MPGVRVQHPTKRNTTFTLVDSSRPYHQPWTCPPPPDGCASTHLFKTYHLRLDETGAALVSIEVLERLRRIPSSPFLLANEVKEPPPQRLKLPTTRLLLRAPPPGE